MFLRDVEIQIEMELEICYALFWYKREKLIKVICERNQEVSEHIHRYRKL